MRTSFYDWKKLEKEIQDNKKSDEKFDEKLMEKMKKFKECLNSNTAKKDSNYIKRVSEVYKAMNDVNECLNKIELISSKHENEEITDELVNEKNLVFDNLFEAFNKIGNS